MASWFKFKDITTGSELFGGSDIYAYVESAIFGGGNNVGNNPIQGVNTEIVSDEDGVGNAALSSRYNTRMGYNSYASFNNPTIKLSGNWTEETGSLNNVGSILTPYKLWRMIHSDHQFKITGGLTIKSLLDGESIAGESNILYYYPSLEGLPVIFTSPWQISENYRQGTNHVKWDVNLRLDREE